MMGVVFYAGAGATAGGGGSDGTEQADVAALSRVSVLRAPDGTAKIAALSRITVLRDNS